ncbi:PAS domain-containing protein [Pelagibius litoralis]|uniref:PAS domain-containing protein n=1 Tax=Pelagibius litoralis TaxID=374515 RepID=A0A967CAS3_9PROT|nr:PAS domain-containing protein [Pelagibius litoralis]NIA67634.1 PAS domain-containing protein [Pelagibius litoralis]
MELDDRIRSEMIRCLYDYWSNLLAGRQAPARSDVDPRAMPRILPHLGLFDVENDPRRYRVRLMGTNVVEWYGCDVTGHYLDEIDLGLNPGTVFSILDHVVRSMTPAHMVSEYTKQDGRRIRCERIVLPLSDNQRQVNMLLGASVQLSVASDDATASDSAIQPASG